MKILVATAGSRSTLRAVRYAASLGHLLHTG